MQSLRNLCEIDAHSLQSRRATHTHHHSPLTTHHSPLTTHHSPLTTHHSPLTTHRSPLTTHHSPLTPTPLHTTTHYSPLTAHHSPLTTHHSPLTAHHSPLTTHHSPLTTHHSPLTTHHSPLTIHPTPPHHTTHHTITGSCCAGTKNDYTPNERVLFYFNLFISLAIIAANIGIVVGMIFYIPSYEIASESLSDLKSTFDNLISDGSTLQSLGNAINVDFANLPGTDCGNACTTCSATLTSFMNSGNPENPNSTGYFTPLRDYKNDIGVMPDAVGNGQNDLEIGKTTNYSQQVYLWVLPDFMKLIDHFF
jgi:hypothetical protein